MKWLVRGVVLSGGLALAGCAGLGRGPMQSDVSCLRQQMAPPENYAFTAAASVCAVSTDDNTLTQLGSHTLLFDLASAPDLLDQARRSGESLRTIQGAQAAIASGAPYRLVPYSGQVFYRGVSVPAPGNSYVLAGSPAM